MTNHLADETSPYLRQHAENPVDWYPWSDEAFEKARAEDKPVFLSVGYSACHWCHVMERESFEDPHVAELLNKYFVSVKVDREERPDVDAIYMEAVQAMTGHGGWPMSVFLTPEGVPFYGGTYFPDTPRHGMPAFFQVLEQLATAWIERRDEIARSAEAMQGALEHDALANLKTAGGALNSDVSEKAVAMLERSFDRVNAGFGGAPKFPQPMVLDFLLGRFLDTGQTRTGVMVTATLDAMARGGIYDQLGGGFHRYAVDSIWLVPHFEKMLYDNAQLATVYTHAWQVTGDDFSRRVASETLEYVMREMTDPSGGFYSAQDADSEGEEGKFFVWTPEQIAEALPRAIETELGMFFQYYGVSPAGNFEGSNILHIAEDLDRVAHDNDVTVERAARVIASMRADLFAVRADRIKPGLDDKVLASWNGLALAAFAQAARAFDDARFLEVAQRNAAFLLEQMCTSDGRMLRTWKDGAAKLNGYLEDYAAVALGLLELYQADFDERWFVAARDLCDAILEHFADPEGGFFDTSDDHERLITRPKGVQDGAQPSGGSEATRALLLLSALTGDARYQDAAEMALAQMQAAMAAAPLGFANWLLALDFTLAPPVELAIVGERAEPLLDVARRAYRPDLVVAVTADANGTAVPLLRDRTAIDGVAAAYVCRGFACERPVTDPAALASALGTVEGRGA